MVLPSCWVKGRIKAGEEVVVVGNGELRIFPLHAKVIGAKVGEAQANPWYAELSYTPQQNVPLPTQALECHITAPKAFFFSGVIPTKAAIATCVDTPSCGVYVRLRTGNGKASCRVLRMPPHGKMTVSDLPYYLRNTIERRPKALRDKYFGTTWIQRRQATATVTSRLITSS